MSMALADSVERLYEEAFTRDWPRVLRFALASTNDLAAAEDLAQDAYLRLWQNRENLDWARPVLPWLLTTTRRLSTDRFRQLKRRVLPHPSIATADEVVRVRWLDVQRAMGRLSRLERIALVSTSVEGFSPEDTAKVLGISPGAVRAAVSRARAKLEAT